MGLGNLILRDEGLGVHAVNRLLDSYRLPGGIEAIDGGTLGLALLPYIQDTETLMIIDAVSTGREPGTIVRLEGDEIPAALALKMSMHQLGLQELLAIAAFQGSLPRKIVLWGIEPATIEPGVGLTETVAAQIDRLVDTIVEELRSWELAVEPRPVCTPLRNEP